MLELEAFERGSNEASNVFCILLLAQDYMRTLFYGFFENVF